jgi:hypothetical protein
MSIKAPQPTPASLAAAGLNRYGRKPMKLSVGIFSFLIGALFGAALLSGYWYWRHSSTEVWVATHSLESDNGIFVPAGTEMILERWMPEGFAALQLGINVEGVTLDNFQRHTEQASFLRIPYFVDIGSE